MILDYTEKVKETQKSGIVAAFYSAYFSRLEKLSGSNLDEVLKSIDGNDSDEAMSDEAMYRVLKGLARS